VDAVIGVEMMSQSEPESTTVPPLPKGECSNPNRAFAKRALWAYDRIAPCIFRGRQPVAPRVHQTSLCSLGACILVKRVVIQLPPGA